MRLASIFLCIFIIPAALFGGYSRVSGHWSPDRYIPLYSVQEHYDQGQQEMYDKNWDDALVHFMIIRYHFQDSPFFADALYYTAICYYFKAEYDLANKQFDKYLGLTSKLKHFEKVFEYKLEIAERFAAGAKKHFFGQEKLPKWSPARNDALTIYDEIIAALPGKDIAAQALYNKSVLLKRKRQYRDSIECLQTLARHYPKHSLAADSYILVSEIYLEQSRKESQNPDLIALAQVNIQRFGKSFPSDERIKQTETNLIAMHEIYAQSLYDTGRFYERRKKPHASMIYYSDAIRKYPGTQAAAKCQDRLTKIS